MTTPEADPSPNWPEDLTATFEQCDPPGRRAGICWRAELYDADGVLTYPVAIAYLTDFRGAGLGVIVDFTLVPDHLRRLGYATRLLRECEARWPDLGLTDAISDAGEGLLDSLEVET